MTDRHFRYVRLHQAEDYLKLGWVPRPALHGTCHGDYSVIMENQCPKGCPLSAEKKPSSQHSHGAKTTDS